MVVEATKIRSWTWFRPFSLGWNPWGWQCVVSVSSGGYSMVVFSAVLPGLRCFSLFGDGMRWFSDRVATCELEATALYIDYLFKMVISHSYLVGGLEHFLFSPIVGMMIQSDFHIFQRGRYTTNQLCYACVFLLFPAWGFIHIHPLASENVPNPSISGNQRVHVIFPVCSDGLLVVYPHKTTMYGKSSN